MEPPRRPRTAPGSTKPGGSSSRSSTLLAPERESGEPHSYYHRAPRWLIHTTPVADRGPSRRSPFYFFFDHFDTTKGVFGWIIANIALGQVAERVHILASVHGWVTVITCFYLALNSERLIIVMSAMCYAGINDTFWRMTSAGVPWETSKYMVLVMSIIILIRWIGRPQSGFCTAIIILLLPGLVEGAQVLGFGDVKATFGFVLLGLIVLAVSTMVTRRLRCTWDDMRIMLWAMIGAVTAVASITLTSVAKLTTASFTSIQSNDAAAGNFGANQVGAVLGLGALFAFYVGLHDSNWLNRLLCVALLLWYVGQSAVTLSRGGLAAVAVALLVATPHILLHEKLGLRFLLGLTLVILIAGVFVVPRLDTFTNGAVNKRFKDTNSTERGQLAAIDMRLFAEHPIFGVGVGVSDDYHRGVEAGGYAIASHTEFTRLLGEQGVFGLAVIMCMLGLVVEGYRRQDNWFGRAWTIGLVGWVTVDLTVASTRNAMNTFVFALAMLAIDDRKREDIPDVDTEVFGARERIIEARLAEHPPTPVATGPDSGASDWSRRQLAQRLRREYRAMSNPNTGSPITLEAGDLEP